MTIELKQSDDQQKKRIFNWIWKFKIFFSFQFEVFYNNNFSGRKLTWMHSFVTVCTISVNIVFVKMVKGQLNVS